LPKEKERGRGLTGKKRNIASRASIALRRGGGTGLSPGKKKKFRMIGERGGEQQQQTEED